MEEKELITKIKALKEIKPSQNWVLETKNEILGEPKKLSLGFLFSPIQKPALALGSVAMLALIFSGLMFSSLNSIPEPLVLDGYQAQYEQEQEVLATLEGLKASLEEMTSKLDNIKKAKDPNQALVMTQAIQATAQQGQEVLKNIKVSNENKQTLASLALSFEELGKEASSTSKEVISTFIENLDARSLTSKDEARLQKIINYYNKGQYDQAALLIQAMSK